jgi:hypothetical protein
MTPASSLPTCSICKEPFDPEKKHMCDGCGSTFSPGKHSGVPAYSPSGKERP